MKKIVLVTTLMMMMVSAIGAESLRKEYQFINGNTTFIKNPFKLRDPFKRQLSQKELSRTRAKQKVFTGVLNTEPTLDGVEISQIRVVGILLGKDRRALAKVAMAGDALSSETYILKEGMTLGPDQAEIKAILPGGIVLVEKMRNVYDQDEYLETIIPVSKE